MTNNHDAISRLGLGRHSMGGRLVGFAVFEPFILVLNLIGRMMVGATATGAIVLQPIGSAAVGAFSGSVNLSLAGSAVVHL
jgi:hypothetical protein